VRTLRTPVSGEDIDAFAPDLVVLSPGPGSPADFGTAATLALVEARGLPVFGVCLGMQAIGDYFGADVVQMDAPQHGKPARIRVTEAGRIFDGLPDEITVGRYHSLHVVADTLPADIAVTAATPDGVAMAIEHRTRPVAAVQFHPESIMSLGGEAGYRMIENVVARLVRP